MIRSLMAVTAFALATPAVAATDFTVVGQSSVDSFTYAKIEWTRTAGVTESGVLRLACTNGVVSSAAIYAPRDAASGMATGKRMHKPFTIVKDWGPASPAAMKGSWHLATMKGARAMAVDDWQAVSVTGLDGACAARPVGKVNVQDLSLTK